jgi:hypothetical protein
MKRLDWFDRQFQIRLYGTDVALLSRAPGWHNSQAGKKIAGASEAVLTWQPEGRWSIKQHTGHLAEVDVIALRRIAEIVAGTSSMSAAVFELTQDFNEQPVAHLIAHFRTHRVDNLKVYESLTETDCLKFSMHPRLKVPMTPVDLAFFEAEYDDHTLSESRKLNGSAALDLFCGHGLNKNVKETRRNLDRNNESATCKRS